MNKFKKGDRVVIMNKEYHGHIGKIDTVYPDKYLVRVERCTKFNNIFPMNESVLRPVEISDEYINDEFELKLECIRHHLIENRIYLEKSNSLLDYSYYYEMAGRIPKDKTGKCNLIIAVGGNERSLPHFHVFRKEEDLKAWRNGACLFFTENAYFDHKNNKEILIREELDMVISRLKETNNKRKINNWEYLVMLWNDNNPNYEIDDDIPMPNYDYKTIKRYEEHKKDNKL